MGLSRAQLAAKLWGRLQRPFTEVGIVNEDTSGNLMEPLDDTLAAFGVVFSDWSTGTIADGDEVAAIKVAIYYGYEVVIRSFSKVTGSKSLGAPSASRSDNWSDRAKDLRADLEKAKSDASEWLPADGSWGAGSLSLGFIPDCSDITAEWGA